MPYWRDPPEQPPEPLLESLRRAHAAGAQAPRPRRGGGRAGGGGGGWGGAAAGLGAAPPPTTHWALAGVLAQMYPKISVRASVLYIDDGDILTAGGGAAGMDWPLWTTP